TRLLRDQGFTVVADPESFLVDTHDRLLAGQLEQARRWGAGLSPALAPR
ncbi:MAG: hypothetical protein JWP61_2501, partial [Friedmanniella sp.]|nr:hypothetical protein [Friedmanniella sp.]